VPERIVTNADLEKIVNTNDEWIRSRTGIEQRRWAAPGTTTSELALPAVRECLDRRGLDPAELDLIVVATVTPDTVFPATACVLQEKLKARRAWGFDISAACSGFVYALTMGAQFVETGAHDKVLVVGADVMTSILDMQDRTTCVLFGDGAGAVVIGASTQAEFGLLGTKPSWDMMQKCDTLLLVGTNFPYSEFLPKENDARAVHGHCGQHPLLHQVDDQRRKADLDRMGSHAEKDSPSGSPPAGELTRRLAQLAGGEQIGKARQQLRDRSPHRDGTAERLRLDLARA